MYASNVECRDVPPDSFTFAFSLCLCLVYVQPTTYHQFHDAEQEAGSLISPLKLLLLSVKNAGLHVYNMDILYTAKHAGAYQTPLLTA